MRDGVNKSGDAASDAKREAAEQRPLKIRMREVIRKKHAERSAGAAKTSKAK